LEVVVMDLREFVRESIVEIIQGVAEAQEATRNSNARVNPTGLSFRSDQLAGKMWDGKDHRVAQLLEFDVAVTASEGTGTKAKIGVLAGVLGAGVEGSEEAKAARVSRIKFAVHVLLPTPAPDAAA
jgi:hypothetical protein